MAQPNKNRDDTKNRRSSSTSHPVPLSRSAPCLLQGNDGGENATSGDVCIATQLDLPLRQTSHRGPSQAKRGSEDIGAMWTAYEQEDEFQAVLSAPVAAPSVVEEPPCSPAKRKRPFYKWVRTLNRRRFERRRTPQLHGSRRPASALSSRQPANANTGSHGDCRRHSSSVSSFAFVSAARNASISLASASIMGQSRRWTLRSSNAPPRTNRSSRASYSVRHSEDGRLRGTQQLDPAVTKRSLHRRRILEELIRTEEGYIGDIRFLMNAYMTIFASSPSLHAGLRSSINNNLADIVELHDELLGELHKVVPDSEYTQMELPSSTTCAPTGCDDEEQQGLDALLENQAEELCLKQTPGMTAEPLVAAEVARVFTRKMHSFFVYEEYGAKYKLMFNDLGAAYRLMPNWGKYQKGLETLAYCLNSTNDSKDSKKALTLGDLLAKRVCKYPLLFSELLKYTPIYDCPDSYADIEHALARLREVTAAMNRAANDSFTKNTLERTWLLQDRLVLPSHLYEVVMTACTSKEECEWRQRLSHRSENGDRTHADASSPAFLALNIKSLGAVYGKPSTIARRVSIRRATTGGSKSQLCQIILKNTSAELGTQQASPDKACINRSQSLQTNSRIPVLAPRREDRARLETLTADVWTQDILPFPGMTIHPRGGRLVRSPASSAIRKMSVANLSSTFGRRPPSRTGVRKTVPDVEPSSARLSSPQESSSPGSDESDAKLESGQLLRGDEDESVSLEVAKQALYCLEALKNKPQENQSHAYGCNAPAPQSFRNDTTEKKAPAVSIRRAFARFFEEGW
ncbi:RSP protein [Niveomyces insectorum RCEF 264]|uniref:RSP protein n=1 Tax=Niveomyces insectorum RCEF 264 TaxID=1081102 RepID=A0A167X2S9_9HYPO|nr:RSP protein [Niveomyces insectorum RCEF 264]